MVHKNMAAYDQAAHVRMVKRYESGVIHDPITVSPHTSIAEVLALTRSNHISGVPVVDGSELVGIVTGTIAGLASITPASGYVGPASALLIGAVAGVLCQEAVALIRNRTRLDDTLDGFAVHGVGGIFGTVMVAVLGAGAWVAQIGALVIVGVFTLAGGWVLIRLCALAVPLRVDAEAEFNGLDIATHGERADDMNS